MTASMILYWLTLAVAAVIVLVLAGYLIGIAVQLVRARRHVADLADGLEAIADHTEGLEERVESIGGALETAAEEFAAVDRHLGGAAEVFGRRG